VRPGTGQECLVARVSMVALTLRIRGNDVKNHNDARRSIATLRLEGPSDDRLRRAFAAIGEPCRKQPEVFPQVRHGIRSPWRSVFRYFAQAFHAAPDHNARKSVVERITAFFLEGIAHVRTWLVIGAPMCRIEVFESAQQADGDEDMAETLYLMNPSPTNRDRLVEAGRLERQRSEMREHYLLHGSTPKGGAA
jgi:hypothetical protein